MTNKIRRRKGLKQSMKQLKLILGMGIIWFHNSCWNPAKNWIWNQTHKDKK